MELVADRQVLDSRQKSDPAALLCVEDVLRATDPGNLLGLRVYVRQHHPKLVDQVRKPTE